MTGKNVRYYVVYLKKYNSKQPSDVLFLSGFMTAKHLI